MEHTFQLRLHIVLMAAALHPRQTHVEFRSRAAHTACECPHMHSPLPRTNTRSSSWERSAPQLSDVLRRAPYGNAQARLQRILRARFYIEALCGARLCGVNPRVCFFLQTAGQQGEPSAFDDGMLARELSHLWAAFAC